MKRRLKLSPLYIAAAVLLICLIFFLFVFNRKASPAKAEMGLRQYTTAINQSLRTWGFKSVNQYEGPCDTTYADENFRSVCTKTYGFERQLDGAFIDVWPARSKDLEKILSSRGWQRQPNHDPVTKDPVSTLPDLLKYKGVYDADVWYQKIAGNLHCSILFSVAARDEATGRSPLIEVNETCSDIVR
jgi:hypothetical protein